MIFEKLPLPPVFYHGREASYWREDDAGGWIKINETAAKNFVANFGYPARTRLKELRVEAGLKKAQEAQVAFVSGDLQDAALKLQWVTNCDKEVKVAMCRNTNAPIVLLLQLVNDSNGEVKLAASFGLARSPNTPLNILQDLARNARYDVKNVVARNPAVPRELLEELLKNPEYRVWIVAFRVLASQNPPPKELLRQRLQAADVTGIEHRCFKDERGMPEWVNNEF